VNEWERVRAAAAAGLEEAAEAAARREGYAVAASALERAAELSPNAADGAARTIRAADAWRLSGAPERALALLDALPADDPLTLAEVERVRARVERLGEPPAAFGRLVRAAATIADDHPAKAAELLSDAAAAALEGDGFQAAEAAARQAAELGGPELPQQRWPDVELAERAVASARERAGLGLLPGALEQLGTALQTAGRWDEASAALAETIELAEGLAQRSVAARAHHRAALIDAARGREESCRRHARQAAASAADAGFEDPTLEGLPVGLLELGLGRPDAAVGALERTASVDGRPLPPALTRGAALLVEAYVRAGRLEDARRTVDVFARAVENLPAGWLVERCRGLLEDGFEDAFAAALETTAGSFERARTELLLGERRRRAARPTAARKALRSALRTFERLGAEPWTARARAELEATGEQRQPNGMHGLTRQELRVAQAAAGGATNREIAAALFLSPRTVEYHLRNAYRKLRVRSRTELARQLD
jgi:DNA-binding CsgD family transcriptional regulator